MKTLDLEIENDLWETIKPRIDSPDVTIFQNRNSPPGYTSVSIRATRFRMKTIERTIDVAITQYANNENA